MSIINILNLKLNIVLLDNATYCLHKFYALFSSSINFGGMSLMSFLNLIVKVIIFFDIS